MPPDPPWKNSRALPISLLLIVLASVLIWTLRTYQPSTTAWYPKCVFYQATGFHCPGCGGTRAIGALAVGNLPLAIRNNPMLILGVPAMLLLVGLQRRREKAGRLTSPRLAWTLFLILVLYFIARNVPSPTRSWLAPPAAVKADYRDAPFADGDASRLD